MVLCHHFGSSTSGFGRGHPASGRPRRKSKERSAGDSADSRKFDLVAKPVCSRTLARRPSARLPRPVGPSPGCPPPVRASVRQSPGR
eukprot:7804056-Heterocapsa_arctica.AAC.1